MVTDYVRPGSVDEAVAALSAAAGNGIILAGGLVVGSIINQRLGIPGVMVDISRIDTLRRIERSADGGLIIGATATHDDVLHAAEVNEAAPLLAEIAADIACGRLRNRGTMGGSLCMVGAQGDPATGLIALGASLRLRGPKGERVLPVEDFYKGTFSVDLQEGEILVAVLVPPLQPRSGYGFAKIGPRAAMDFTLVVSAAGLTLGEDGVVGSARLAINGVGSTVVRLREIEHLFEGRTRDQVDWGQAIDVLQGVIDPQGDPVYSEQHKRRLAGVAVHRAVQQAFERTLLAEGVRA
jgi:aerobic carbon-monoxide dehydrogenase medium subunit